MNATSHAKWWKKTPCQFICKGVFFCYFIGRHPYSEGTLPVSETLSLRHFLFHFILFCFSLRENNFIHEEEYLNAWYQIFPLLRNTKLLWIGKLIHSPTIIAIIYAQKYGSPPCAASYPIIFQITARRILAEPHHTVPWHCQYQRISLTPVVILRQVITIMNFTVVAV